MLCLPFRNFRNNIGVNSIHGSAIFRVIIITFKKYFALYELKQDYQYLATCDSEVRFINIKNITERFKNYCENKKIIGSVVSLGSQNIDLAIAINKGSSVFFEEDLASAVSYGFRFYFWFSDIPVYDSYILSRYFDFINFGDFSRFSEKIDWYFFDYISYGLYCLSFEGYSHINIMDFGINRNWSLESMPFDMYEKVLELGYNPMWLIYNTWKENADKVGDKIILTYHRNDGRYTNL